MKVMQSFMILALVSFVGKTFCASQEEITTVKLKNGTTTSLILASTTKLALETLRKTNYPEFYDVVTKAREPDYKMWYYQQAHKLSLIEVSGDGQTMPDSIRDIVLSAVTGSAHMMVIDNPIAHEIVEV